jgi:hypothetical protein
MARRPAMRAVARTASIPAPVGGLNGRDSIAEMKPTDAVIMENVFPDVSQVSVRRGSLSWSTGYGAAVETLMPYKTGSQAKLFAASGTAFYDATNSGAVGAAVQTGLSNARWEFTQFGTSGGQFLVCVNGVDNMRQWDGSAWKTITGVSTPAITGVSTNLFSQVTQFKRRLFFVEKNSMRVWYLPVDSIAGAAASLDFGPLFKLGGSLLFMVTWTIDNYAGIDDFAAFVTTEGEVAVYKGTDPSSAANWAIVGTFRIGRPVDVRSFVKFSGDVILLTADGFVSLAKSTLIDRQEAAVAISNKIVNLATTDVELYKANTGWTAILHPVGNKFIVNVPTSGTTSYQYVMNTISNAWCKFTGWNARCFALMNDVLYYGGQNSVVVADVGTDDQGAAITTDCLPAFNYFGSPGQKRFTMCRPILTSSVQPTALLALYTDFNTTVSADVPPLFSDSTSATWNVSLWNVSLWSGSPTQTYRDWYSVAGNGFSASLRFRVQVKGASVAWAATDVVYEPGGVL